jgi:N-acetylneuraminic acid mutarotase
MTTPRDGLAAATGPDGRIYAIGGFDTDYLSSVEAYDVATNSWTHVASMVHPRYTFAAVTGPDKQIYAIGGEFRFASINTVEVYNTATNSWSPVAPMTTPRRQLAAAVGKDGRIYAIGGINNLTGPLATVEAFSP